MNEAQHIWLAIMTECAMSRCRYSKALLRQWVKHVYAAGIEYRVAGTRDGWWHKTWR